MDSDEEQKTALACAAERRSIGRQHTARLLKMLRGGYGTLPEAEVDTPPLEHKPARIADAAPAYVRLVEAPLAPPVSVPDRSAAPPVPSVGDALRHPSERLSPLMARMAELNEASRVFHAYLRPDLREHAVLVRLDQDVWTVQTESAVWAIRLHYALFDMRKSLEQHFGITLPKPQIHIAPLTQRRPSAEPRRRLTREAARYLEETARNESDPHLSAVLRRLARRAEPSTSDHALYPPQQPS